MFEFKLKKSTGTNAYYLESDKISDDKDSFYHKAQHNLFNELQFDSTLLKFLGL